jgi:hypothetical protein
MNIFINANKILLDLDITSDKMDEEDEEIEPEVENN